MTRTSRKSFRCCVLVRSLLACLVGAAAPAVSAGQGAPTRTVLVGGTVYPGPDTAPIINGTVVIEGGKIVGVGRAGAVQIPSGATVMDCKGLTVMAGFWNAHVHFAERKWIDASRMSAQDLEVELRQMLTGFGFTSVFDTGSPLSNTRALAARIDGGEIAGPKIYTTGEIIFPKGGLPQPMILQVTGMTTRPMLEAGSAAEAAEMARRQMDGGADAVKAYGSTWSPPIVSHSVEAIRAMADVAHARGRLLFVHPSDSAGLNNAIDGHADVLAHVAPGSGPWSAALVDRMKAAHIVLIPTLKLWEWEGRHDQPSQSQPTIARAVEQFRTYWRAGGTVVFGTDVGYIDDYDPAREYELLHQTGLDVSAILAMLTTTPTRVFSPDRHVGRIASGYDADLVVLAGDPAQDPRFFARVRTTLRGGRVIYRQP